MNGDPEETYNFLARTYRVAKLIALSVISFVGILVSIAALNIQISDTWTSTGIPFYAIVGACLVLTLLLGVPLILALISWRDSLNIISIYRSKALNLQAMVAGLEELAYTDAITGLPNTYFLKNELARTSGRASRCLIMLDLQNFGSINKKYGHWAGDEYLRKFSGFIVQSGRRNEYVFKDRPESALDTEIGKIGRIKLSTFRKSQGSDEFFVLLEGSIFDGLGYLNRLKRLESKINSMSTSIFDEVHPFGFHAGLIAVGINEPAEESIKRVSKNLCIAQNRHDLYVYWTQDPSDLGAGTKKNETSKNAQIEADSKELFRKSKAI